MSTLTSFLIFISSLSFLAYGFAYFLSSRMKSEFKRFGLQPFGALTAILEILGAIGLLVGLKIHFILLFSSGGLAILMLLGLVVRLKIKDSLRDCSPAFLFLVINSVLFYLSLNKR